MGNEGFKGDTKERLRKESIIQMKTFLPLIYWGRRASKKRVKFLEIFHPPAVRTQVWRSPMLWFCFRFISCGKMGVRSLRFRLKITKCYD